MAQFDKTTIADLLQECYTDTDIANLCYSEKERPLLAKIKKNTKFFGSTYSTPGHIVNPQGISATFSHSLANIGASTTFNFKVEMLSHTAVAEITRELYMRTMGQKNAFIEGASYVLDSVLAGLSDEVAFRSYRARTGVRGVISGTPSGYTVTLSNIGDAVGFHIGMSVVAAASTASALRSSTALVVSAVNVETGVITFATSTPGSLSWADGDSLFREGDYDSANDVLCFCGLASWLPSTDPTSGDSFWGEDRSADPVKMAGFRYDGTGKDVEEAIINASYNLAAYGPGMPDLFIANPYHILQLVNGMGSKVTREAGGEGKAGFSKLIVTGARGPIEVIADTFCPRNVGYLLQSDTWEYVSPGELIQIIDEDGSKIQRSYDSNAFQVRFEALGNLRCKAPGRNARVTL